MVIDSIYHWWKETWRYRVITFRISRVSHYQLQMICDAINKRVNTEYEITPEMITSRVMETFIEEAFSDSTNRIAECIVPELKRKRRHVK
ncbi:hypothetical protein [Paenibacillus polymyxa]|uniref:hypothetical protein n=1 Tax=Paenibacillus polymyxa TaxID=1406 RepID=UPI0025B73491|nr:hypothetical protein [Paenibacillus polymyxa]MDN4106659.1 hypothetical protein [Paenibacillus polymyxa]